jgi:Carboxypeptidase regulatory-like domain
MAGSAALSDQFCGFKTPIRVLDSLAALCKNHGIGGGITSSTLKYALLIAVLLLLASIPLAMQRETGGIDGLITNESGSIAKTSVEARNLMSGAVFRAESDASGHYRLELLPRGRYSLWVRAPGHDSVWIREVVVEPGQTAHRDVHLGKSQSGAFPPKSAAAA